MTNFGGPNPIGGGWEPHGQTPQPQSPPQQAAPQWQPAPPPQQGSFAYPAPPQQGGYRVPPQNRPSTTGFSSQIQPRPPAKRRRLVLMIAGAAVAVILVVTGIVVVSSDSSSGPAQAGDTVKGYLEALARGDAEAALSYAINPPPDKTFLTDDILKKQIEKSPISDIRIIESSPTGSVHVVVKFGDNVVDEDLYLKQDGDGGAWKMESVALPVDFQKDKAAEGGALIDAVTLFSEPISKSGRPYVFPGPVEFGSSNPNIEVDVVNPVFLLGNLQWGVNANYNFGVSEAGKEAVKKAMMPVVVECAKSQELSPPNCPQRAGIPGLVEGTATWTAPSTLDDVDFVSGIAEDGKQTVMGTIAFTLTLQATNPVHNATNAARPFSFTGYADMTKQPPVFTFYTRSQ